MQRDLILSKNKKYLKTKNPLLFIGEWCLVNHDKNILSQLDYKICDSKVFHDEIKKIKHEICEKIFISIIKDFRKNLNSLHQTDYSLKSWDIIGGEWLRRFIQMCFDKFELLKKACRDYDINEIFAVNFDSCKFYTKDTSGLYKASIDDEWNHALFSQILKFFNLNEKISHSETSEKFLNNSIACFNTYKSENYESTKVKIMKLIMKISRKFKSENDGLIFESYLPFFYEKKLELSLGQFPQFWETENIEFKTYNKSLREKIHFNYENYDDIEKFIRYILPTSIPICIIESFTDILHKSNNSGFPKNPKFIFTSNAYDFDEIFKLYVANNVDKGVPYYIGQHGNNTYTQVDTDYTSILNTCTKFVTWGQKKNPKDIPMFNLKTVGRKKLFKKNGYLTIITRSLGFRVSPHRFLERVKGVKSTAEIIKNLNPKIKNMTMLRLHPSFLFMARDNFIIKKHFNDLNVKMDFGKKNLRNILKDTRVTFFNYDSTGLLENLTLGMPTLCYWDDTFNHLKSEFFDRYNLLIEGKILFKEKGKLIEHLNNYWDNINDWWLDSLTQKKIKEFNHNFNIRGDNDSFNKLSNIFKNLENNKVESNSADDIYPLW